MLNGFSLLGYPELCVHYKCILKFEILDKKMISADFNVNYTGIYGEQEIQLVRGIIHISTIESVLKNHNNEVKPHVHKNLFQIFMVEEGLMELDCYNQKTLIEAKSFFTIPKNIVHSLVAISPVKGWVISISDMGLEKTLKLDADLFFNIEEINISKMDLSNPLYQNFYHTYSKCIHEFHDQMPTRELALEYLTGMLLIRLFRIQTSMKTAIVKEKNSYKLMYRRFRSLIQEHYTFKFSVEDYAKALNISTSHLNRICKEVANESPKKIIARYFINEAKQLLTKADYSIAEVGYKLGFDDSSYFSRLFKQIDHQTPREFRKSIGL